MLQTLFHIPNQIQINHIGRVPMFGAGLLLAVWAVASLLFLLWLVRRQGFNADTRGYLPLLALIGAAIWLVLPHLADDQGLPIRGYGVMLLLAVSAGVGLTVYRARRFGLDPDMIFSLAFWMFIPGLLGARMFYVVQKWPEEFLPIYQVAGLQAVAGAVVNVAQGGLVVYGSLIGAIAGLAAFIHRYKLPPLATFDLIAPGMLIGLALGRLGCLMNGCCFGGVCNLPWAITFPPGSPPHVYQFEHGQLPLQGFRAVGRYNQLPRITAVEPGSPAAKAGLKPDLYIDTIDGEPINIIHDLYWNLLNPDRPGGRLSIRTVRGDFHRGEIPAAKSPPADAKPIAGDTVLGITFAGPGNAPPVLAEVAEGSTAAKMGLAAKQEVFAINGKRVPTVDAARHELAEWARPGLPISLITVQKRSRFEFAAAAARPRSMPVHPTQLYGAINGLVLCLFLLAWGPFRRRDGELLALTLTLYPVTRFLIEMIRTDESKNFLGSGLTVSQDVSILMLVCAAAVWVAILMKPRGKAFEPGPG